MSCLLHLLLVFFGILNICHAEYMLISSPDRLAAGITEEASLVCLFRGSLSSTSIASVSRLRILKEINPDNFQIVAEVREFESGADNVGLGFSANVTGYIGSVSSSYLSILWDTVTFDMLGYYRCDAIGFRANQDVVSERTPLVLLMESDVNIQDVLDLSIKQKADMQQKIRAQRNYCDQQAATIEAGIISAMWDIENSQYNSSIAFQAAVLDQLERLTANVKRLKDTGVFQYWPEGSYALLMPDSGCPDNVGAYWGTGYRKFHTESTDRNYDNIPASSHLQQPTSDRIDIDNFLYQHFCVSSVRSPGGEWPRGSYCINRVRGICPSGFDYGFITWQDEVTNSKATFAGALPDGTFEANSTSIYYCCRADGSPTNPVYLPRNRPFYLYRFNGVCQEVVQMRTLPGDMTFDTDNSHGDVYQNKYHPDGTIDNVHIELCYYSPI